MSRETTWTFEGLTWSPLTDEYRFSPSPSDLGAFDERLGVGVLFDDRETGPATRIWNGTNFGEYPGYDLRPKLIRPLSLHPAGDRAGMYIPGSLSMSFVDGAWRTERRTFQSPASYGIAYDSDRGLLLAVGSTLQQPQFLAFDGEQWLTGGPTVPGNRSRMGITYDSVRRQLLVFGGSGTGVRQELLGYSAATNVWTQLATGGPRLRIEPGFVFDTARGVAVLFGGFNRDAASDTWEWNGTAWRQVPTTLVPAVTPITSATYHPGLARVLMATNPATGPSEIWAYDGVDWQVLSTAPGLIVGMTHDPATGKVLTQIKLATEAGLATYVWDQSGWSRMTRPSPAQFRDATVAYDAARERLVMRTLDSTGVASFASETWEHDGTGWTLMAREGPAARWKAAMTYDRGRGRVVLFGGSVSLGNGENIRPTDTWEWDGVSWSRVAETGPAGRVGHSMSYDEARGVVVLFGGNLFDSNFATDTWEWNGATWTRAAAPGARPPGRQDASQVFDPASGLTILSGGRTGNVDFFDDTWAFDGTNWLPVASPAGFFTSVWPGHFYDRVRGVLVNVFQQGALQESLREWRPGAIRVVLDPEDASIKDRGTLRLNGLIRSNVPVELRWHRDGVPLVDDGRVAGATSGALTIRDTTVADSGFYELVGTSCAGDARAGATVLVQCLADFNRDGFIDFFDYDVFVGCFEDASCPPDLSADTNGDGMTDCFDYMHFVEAFETGCR